MRESSPQKSSISMTVIRKVADAEGVEPLKLESALYNAIDNDALEVLCASMAEGVITFEYSGYEVTVTSEGEVTVTDAQ